MDRFEDVVLQLSQDGIVGELWVDGSFLTHKIDPQDADVVLCVQSPFVDNASITQKDRLDWFAGDLKPSHECDTYVFVEYPVSDPQYWVGDFMRAYWKRQFGFARSNQLKGIAVVHLPLT
jgi:hypothetical protein